MTPKEKANQLGNAMYNGSVFDYDKEGHLKEIENAKRCALIAVDVILIDCGAKDWLGDEACEGKNYWQEVKKEIEKL